MSTAYGGGVGGGFGGFPYRSAHQQGSDGGGRGGRRRYYYPRKRKKSASLSCAADIVIPATQRVRLIGRGGAVIRQLRETTGATIFVPNNQTNNRTSTAALDKRPVRIKAQSVASLLHTCWKVCYLGLNIGETASAKVRIPSNSPNLCGCVERSQRFFWATSMEVYALETFLDAEEVDTIVDNERFANSSLATVQHETVYLQEEGYPSTLVFVYGPQPEPLYRALCDATVAMWKKECMSDIVQNVANLSTGILTVGTYNVLHSCYAEKYKENAGISKLTHSSNWKVFRAPAIVHLLLESNLDIYLLQEVDMEGLLAVTEELAKAYHIVSYEHPGREATDSVAILARKSRFTVKQQVMVPFKSKDSESGGHYMCSATALLNDATTDKRILVASTHFYTKKSKHPEMTLLEYLEKQQGSCDFILWGGDLNKEYKQNSMPSGYSTVKEGHRFTRGEKKIDWILFSENYKASRLDASEVFVNATMRVLEPTGYPPSDHFGEAITLDEMPSS